MQLVGAGGGAEPIKRRAKDPWELEVLPGGGGPDRQGKDVVGGKGILE